MHQKRGLKVKISVYISILMCILGSLLIILCYWQVYQGYLNLYRIRGENLVEIAANMVDGDRIGKYLETGQKDEYYEELLQSFNNLKKNTDDIAYLYIFEPSDDHFTYILEADAESKNLDDISELGDIYEYTEEDYKDLVPDIQKKQASHSLSISSDVGYGKTIAMWAPVLDSQGNLAAMVEADFLINSLRNKINQDLFWVFLGLGAILILILAVTLWIVNRRVTIPLSELTDFVSSYEGGQFKKEHIRYEKEDEIKWLADSFYHMIGEMEDYHNNLVEMTKEKERIGAELDVATHIQSAMLPCIFPEFSDRKEFAIYATMNPAKEVGGDFYDFFMVDETHLAVVMADVSGKGVPAALFMVIGKTLIRDHTQPGKDLGEVFEDVNNLLCDSNSEGYFITAFEGVLDLETGTFNYVNAGHEVPYLYRKDGNYEIYEVPSGFVLAGMEDMKYVSGSLSLSEGDKLFLYTDGVPEATNAENELYGSDRLTEVLKRNGDKKPEELLMAVKADVDTFVGEASQFDDLTMLGLEYKQKMQ